MTMHALNALGIVDIRSALAKPLARTSATGAAQVRRVFTNSVVVHYNGPADNAAAGGTRSQIVHWINTVIIPNHVARIGADGIQYHFWIAADGTIYQTRDLDMFLWHCGNLDANSRTIAVHVPIGGTQAPTAAMWASFCRLADALIADYGMAGRTVVKGHQEYGASACPGPILMAKLNAWRVLSPRVGNVAAPDALTFVAAPRISAEQFTRVLFRAGSPAAADANALYQIITSYGLEPAVALAFFAHESRYGTLGVCKQYATFNWGNVRTAFDGRRGVQLQQPYFFQFTSWAAGLTDWCERMLRRYVEEKGLTTVAAALPVYAPSSDGNAPARYARAVADLVAQWVREDATQTYRIITGVDFAAVREGRGTGFPIALGGACKLAPGTQITVDDRTDGWAHLSDGRGFISMSLLEAA